MKRDDLELIEYLGHGSVRSDGGETDLKRFELNVNPENSTSRHYRGVSVETRHVGGHGTSGKLISREAHHYDTGGGVFSDVRVDTAIARNEGDSVWGKGRGAWFGVVTGGNAETKEAYAVQANISKVENGSIPLAAAFYVNRVDANDEENRFCFLDESGAPARFAGRVEAAGFAVNGLVGATGRLKPGGFLTIENGIVVQITEE